jgi:hypothetical protein
MNRITYKAGAIKQSVIVYLDGKRVGCIYKVEGGYQYFPGKIKKGGGSILKALKEVKEDLEYDGE